MRTARTQVPSRLNRGASLGAALLQLLILCRCLAGAEIAEAQKSASTNFTISARPLATVSMEGSVYLKARQEWDERYADLVLGEVRLSRIAGTAIGTEHGASVSKA